MKPVKKMLSFIIIGRNEGWKISNCLESVFKAINYYSLKNYEVIYVDSNSSDDSIQRAQVFEKVRIFKIIGHYNPAIARNIGAREAVGEIFFFIDGDMEIQSEFIKLVYEEDIGLKYDFVTGNTKDIEYDFKGNKKITSYKIPAKSLKQKYFKTGGIFLLKREHWFKVNGMKNEMRKNQDIELGLRLAKEGILPVRKPDIIAFHHTVPYNDKNRIWRLLFSGAEAYRAVTFRKNFFNIYSWQFFLRNNYTFFILILSIILSLIFMSPSFMGLYILSVPIRIFARGERSIKLLASRFLYLFVYESMLLFMFLFFFPKRHKEEYISL